MIQRFKQTKTSQATQLLQALGIQQPKPKANIIQRVIAPLMAIGSIPDIIYAAKYQKRNPIKEYLGNIGGGMKTAFLGELPSESIKTTSDLLKRGNILQGRDIGSKFANFGASLAGDVLLDPVTYATFGVGSLGEVGAKTAVKALGRDIAKSGAKTFTKEVSEELTKSLVKGGFKEASEKLAQRGLGDYMELFATHVSKQPLPRTLKVLGGQIPIKNQAVVKAAETMVNPLGATLGLGAKGFKRVAPEAASTIGDTFNRLFRAGKHEETIGLGGLSKKMQNWGRGMTASEREIMLQNGKLIADMTKVDPKIMTNLPHYIEETKAAPAVIKPIIERIKPILEKQGGAAKQAGLLDELVTSYFPRRVVGLNEKFIRDNYGDVADEILASPDVNKALQKTKGKYVPIETVDKVLNEQTYTAPAIKGLREPRAYMKGADIERMFPTQKEGQAAGIVYNKNAPQVFGESLINTNRAMQAAKLEQELPALKDDLGRKIFFTGEEFGGNVPVGYKKLTGLKDVYGPAEAVDVVKNYTSEFLGDEGSKKFLKMYDKALAPWKAVVTGMGPGFIGFNVRNAIGDIINMTLGGFRNRNGAMQRGFDAVMFEKSALKNGVENATEEVVKKKGQQYADEIIDLYHKGLSYGNIKSTSTQFGEQVGERAGTIEELTAQKTLGQRAKNVAKKVFMVEPARMREEGFRLANLWDSFKKYGDWDKAAEVARRSSLDYSNLTPFEKNVMRRIVPFYSFMRQNLENQLNVFVNNPRLISTEMKVFENIKDTLGTNLSEEDWAALPDWMKSGLGMAIGKKGSAVDILTGFGDPTSAIANFIGGGGGVPIKSTIMNLLTSSTPALKIPLETAFGTNLFTGQPIAEGKYGGRYADFPAPLKKWLGYKKVTKKGKDGKEYTQEIVDPQKAYILGNLPFVASTATMWKRLSDAGALGTKDFQAKYLLPLISGGRVYERDVEVEKAKRAKEQEQQIQQALYEKGLGTKYTTYSFGGLGK